MNKRLRRCLSLLFAIALTIGFSVQAFAYSYTDYAGYNGESVEVSGGCGASRVYGHTNCMSNAYYVKIRAEVWKRDYPGNNYEGSYTVSYSHTLYDGPSRFSASVESVGSALLNHANISHYVDDTLVYSRTMYASE